ncbi:DUF6153 family protein [Streptomyces sp. TP-A0356]|uniref:DUF6153 family protein n=1 Tax=Streptomyces sp. TP-A0356 TaxID=1359208 RepID=UPI000AEABD5E|nr:DUF6153 family protein [Streptomyces sp. TP-A0356]
MKSREQYHAPRPPKGRWRALLVLGLLAGLLGMHALAPGGLAPGHPHARHASVAMAMEGHCADGHCGGSHVQHADSTCASGAVSGGPELPALTPDPVAVAAHADAGCSYTVTDPDGARAPPSLAELQLLRI